MNTHPLITPHHLTRKAVIYIRQSTGHQVLSNQESRKLQHAMREHARRLGWDEHLIQLVEADTGTSAQSTAGRMGYRNLLSEVALGQVGIILSYESARLSRNCSDWYPLLDLCALNQCLIADRDGLYDPSSPNGRLLLGMKGILSEVELHTLRGRLLAGIQNKAQRGELALALPAGFLRLEDGRVVKDPDLQVQKSIELVFSCFLELGSASKVVRSLRENGLRLPRRHRNEQTVFRPPSAAAVVGILRNPAYAGAFAYGKTRTIHKPTAQGEGTYQKRRPIEQWRVLVKDRYPAYISWQTFERIQSMLRDNFAEYNRNRTRGVPREGAALLQGLVYCGECGHKMAVQYKQGSHYLCNFLRQQTQAPVCQYLPADPLDRYVIDAFFQALSPLELDLYEQSLLKHHEQQAQCQAAQDRELQRLQYEVHLARRQYERVDPDNRLVAAELERRWEQALRDLHEAEQHFEQARQQQPPLAPTSAMTPELRAAFLDLGQALPTLWQSDALRRSQRKALLRCLIDKVVLRRLPQRDRVHVRIVWRGGALTEADVSVPVGSLQDLSDLEGMTSRILELEAQGQSDRQIAQQLTQEGFRSPHRSELLESTVKTIRLAKGRIHRFRGPRPRRVPGYLTLPQVAQALGVKAHWLYYLINRGIIRIQRDPRTHLYLFPDRPEVLEQLRLLQRGVITHVSCPQEQQDA